MQYNNENTDDDHNNIYKSVTHSQLYLRLVDSSFYSNNHDVMVITHRLNAYMNILCNLSKRKIKPLGKLQLLHNCTNRNGLGEAYKQTTVAPP